MQSSAKGSNPAWWTACANRPAVSTSEKLSGRTTYLRSGGVPVADVGTYGRVELRHLYDGIDLELYTRNRELEFDLIVHPGSDPSAIRFNTGAARSSLDGSGSLLVHGSRGSILRVKSPTTYQVVDGRRRRIGSAYQIHDDGSVSVRIESYDRARELVLAVGR